MSREKVGIEGIEQERSEHKKVGIEGIEQERSEHKEVGRREGEG